MSNSNHQGKCMSKEDLYKYLTFVLTQNVKDEKEAKELRRLSRRVVTMSDVTVLFETLSREQERMVTQVMGAVQVQQRVLEKLGATDEMFKEAQDEYNKDIEEMTKQLQKESEKDKTPEVVEDAPKEEKVTPIKKAKKAVKKVVDEAATEAKKKSKEDK